MSRATIIPSVLLVLVLAVPSTAAGLLRTQTEPVLGDEIARLHLSFPQDPEVTWYLDTFGDGRSSGRRHKGNDLHAPKGSPVYAVAPGIITRMRRSSRPGYYLTIDHGSGWTSWYMHLDNDEPGTDNGRGGPEGAFAAGLDVGSFVDAGQLIGFVGDSGNAEGTEPHTHFELHRNGRAIDPYVPIRQAHQRAALAIHAQRVAALSDRAD